MQAEDNIIPIESDVQKYLDDARIILDNDVATAFKELRLSALLRTGNIKKRTGHSVNRIVFDLVLIPFLMFSNVYLFVRAQYEKAVTDKNRFYRLLENANYNWRRLQLNLSYRVHHSIVNEPPQQQFFIVDETTVEVKGKLIEMASYVYDQTLGKTVLGFQKLALGVFDGYHFIPIGQRICTSKRKPNAKSKATKYNKIPKVEKIAPESPGAIERKESQLSKLEKAISLLKQAQSKGFEAKTLLVDSWFCFNSFIIKVVEKLKLDVICQLKNLPRTNKYIYKDKTYTLNALFTAIAKPKLRMVKKYQVKQAVLTVALPKSKVTLKIVFVQNPEHQKWHAFAATDIQLSAKAILEAYSKRWSIEVFFKNCKQYLNLGKEQMSNLDSIIASDTLVMMRYSILTYIAAKVKAKFYAIFDTLRDQNTKQCFGIKLLLYFLNQLRFIVDKVKELIELGLKEQAIELLEQLKLDTINAQQLQPQMK